MQQDSKKHSKKAKSGNMRTVWEPPNNVDELKELTLQYDALVGQ